MRYRPFSYYATPEQRDARALDTLRTVLACEAFDEPPPDDDEREAIDRALAAERSAAIATLPEDRR